MAQWLKQSTAAVVPFGPFLDKTDGVTLENGAGIITSIDHATTGIFLSKNGGTGTIRHQNVTASTYDSHGMFLVTLDTTDTNTLGRLRVFHSEPATYLEVWQDFMVVPANVWDSMFGSSRLLTDVDTIKTQAVTCGAAVTVYPAVGAAYEIDVASTGEVGLDFNNIKDAGGAHTLTNITVPTVTALTNAVAKSPATLAAADVTGNLPSDVVNWKGSAAPAMTGDAFALIGATGSGLTTITAKTNLIPASPAAVGSAMTLAADAVDAAALKTDAVTEIVAAVLAGVVEGTVTLAHAVQAILASCAGKMDGGGTGTLHFRDQADSKNRITGTVDVDGNRTAITISYD